LIFRTFYLQHSTTFDNHLYEDAESYPYKTFPSSVLFLIALCTSIAATVAYHLYKRLFGDLLFNKLIEGVIQGLSV
jgi:hypothetical protein